MGAGFFSVTGSNPQIDRRTDTNPGLIELGRLTLLTAVQWHCQAWWRSRQTVYGLNSNAHIPTTRTLFVLNRHWRQDPPAPRSISQFQGD